MTEPLVSICCITYNHESYIREALDGFLSQKTSFPIEIIIHDDASTDSTQSIIKEYCRNDSRIKPILREKNIKSQGIPVMPFTFKIAQGKYIALCEGDDYWIDSYKLQKQVDEMEKHLECQISFHPAKRLNQKTRESYEISKWNDEDKIVDVAKIIMGDGSYCPTASLCFRRELVQDLPDFFYRAPVGDYFLQVLGAAQGGALYLNQCMSVYRTGIGTAWRDSMDLIENRVILLERFHNSIDELDEFLGKKYNKVFRRFKAKRLALLALAFLVHKNYVEYRKYITLGQKTFPNSSIFSIIMYYFRFCPWVVFTIIKLYKPSLLD